MPFSWAGRSKRRTMIALPHARPYGELPVPRPAGIGRSIADRLRPRPQNDERPQLHQPDLVSRGSPTNEPWIGLNCSACHTARFTYQGQETSGRRRAEPARLPELHRGVDAAMAATQSDPAKWERFAARVLAGRDTPANREMLQREFGRLMAFQQDNARLNATTMRYGYGRLDAVGHILNKVAQLAVYETSPRVRATPNAADAPVSYPFLWDIYRHNRLQWNGIVGSRRISLRGSSHYIDVGALGRNTGEVIGVFGDVVLRPNSSPHGFRSSVETRQSRPARDGAEAPRSRRDGRASFPALNQSRVDAGRALFEKQGLPGMPHDRAGRHVDLPGPHGCRSPATRRHAEPQQHRSVDGLQRAHLHQRHAASWRARAPAISEATRCRTRHRCRRCSRRRVIGTIVGNWKELIATAGQHLLRDRTASAGGRRRGRGQRGRACGPVGSKPASRPTTCPAGERASALRLQGAAARRHLGDRALSPQRLGADALRSAAAARAAAAELQRGDPRI